MKIRKIYRRRCRSIKSLLSLLVSSVVNPNYFIVVLFYPFNILVALFRILFKVFIYLKVYGLHACMQYSNELFVWPIWLWPIWFMADMVQAHQNAGC